MTELQKLIWQKDQAIIGAARGLVSRRRADMAGQVEALRKLEEAVADLDNLNVHKDEPLRCENCGWPVGDEPAKCRVGDCSMRPMPHFRQDIADRNVVIRSRQLVGIRNGASDG